MFCSSLQLLTMIATWKVIAAYSGLILLGSHLRQGGNKPGKPEYSGISLNTENSRNSQGILCNLREKL